MLAFMVWRVVHGAHVDSRRAPQLTFGGGRGVVGRRTAEPFNP
jgi:hypothetical protein